jgi:hypothetical protein
MLDYERAFEQRSRLIAGPSEYYANRSTVNCGGHTLILGYNAATGILSSTIEIDRNLLDF